MKALLTIKACTVCKDYISTGGTSKLVEYVETFADSYGNLSNQLVD